MRPDNVSNSRSKPSGNRGVRHKEGAFVGGARGSSRGMGPGPARFTQRARTMSLSFEPHSAAIPHFSPGIHVSSQNIRTTCTDEDADGSKHGAVVDTVEWSRRCIECRASTNMSISVDTDILCIVLLIQQPSLPRSIFVINSGGFTRCLFLPVFGYQPLKSPHDIDSVLISNLVDSGAHLSGFNVILAF